MYGVINTGGAPILVMEVSKGELVERMRRTSSCLRLRRGYRRYALGMGDSAWRVRV